MSDYLSHLVSRSFSPTEVIQPQLASLFELLHATGGLISGHALGLETVNGALVSGETALDVPSPVRSPARRLVKAQPPVTGLTPSPDKPQQGRGDLPTTPGQRFRPPTGQEPTPVAVLPPVAAQPFATRAPGRAHSDRPTVTPAAARAETGAAPPGSAAEGQPQRALEPAIQQIVIEGMVSPGVPPPTSAISGETEAVSSQSTAAQESRNVLGPTIQRPELSPIPTAPARVVTQPHVTRYVKPAAPVPAEPTQAREARPTIQVTIGRVEVRATPAAPSPKKRRHAPSVMSLDEYLRQRVNGGNR